MLTLPAMLISDMGPYRSALRESWHHAVREIGLDPTDFKSSLLWKRVDSNRARFILKLARRSGPDLVFKRVFKPEQSDSFLTGITAQRRVCEALSDPLTAPKVLTYSKDNQTVLMDHVPGKTAHDALFDARSREEEIRILHLSGQWIGVFHQAFAEPARRFQTRFILKHMQNRLDAFDQSAKTIRHSDQYLKILTALLKTGDEADGAELPVGLNHGDLHSKNIIVGAGRVSGIDFQNNHSSPACYDLARFLVDATARTIGAPSTGQALLDPDLSDAFWDGYGTNLANNPAMSLMLKVRLLEDWIAIPQGRLNRMQRARFDNVVSLSNVLQTS
ncbi:aminoglycoside phosphotransferase family protein [Aestuariibius insulae]|uniref:aminoglycoside phosphotransferase family protein n=1 Tax=Aestuariibius insulae TaxID=2058287 RepID=UPI003484806F